MEDTPLMLTEQEKGLFLIEFFILKNLQQKERSIADRLMLEAREHSPETYRNLIKNRSCHCEITQMIEEQWPFIPDPQLDKTLKEILHALLQNDLDIRKLEDQLPLRLLDAYRSYVMEAFDILLPKYANHLVAANSNVLVVKSIFKKDELMMKYHPKRSRLYKEMVRVFGNWDRRISIIMIETSNYIGVGNETLSGLN